MNLDRHLLYSNIQFLMWYELFFPICGIEFIIKHITIDVLKWVDVQDIYPVQYLML
jgi:hypothetical protein